jgi:pimeloyl-ACP methyl ester carboxylesterase
VAAQRSISLSEVRLDVVEAGVGGRPLLLLHGITGAKEDFRDAIDDLAAEGHWVVAPDQRGHGSSDAPAPESAYSLARFAADAAELIGALGWERADVLGHSMGGMIAQVLVLEHPELVSRLVLMDTVPGAVPGLDHEIMRLGIELCRAEGMASVLAVMKMGEGALETPAHLRMVAEVPGWEEFEDGKFLASSPAMWSAMMSEFLVVEDRLDRLRSVSVPTLVIVGEQDRPFLEGSARMADVIAGARHVVVPDAGHSPQFESPGPWWAALADFMRSTRPAE